ncbi:hypothetical protein VDBG_08995 [Verticillium alfalfae VaMs.102]|uniref:Uncharacterized protein n=2 Tax=Verticillium TaxID=1036719 RepID=G2X523_VERDV|nr:hypothetical protein VDBG_08995 [Verticillium alfalfae VaMs.102]XP_009653286.1 uncharacterized protein VDAG_05255 [Verticillium dahliae VdLs.17]EEY22885.1 hypothetical protein VDBG_08995 [Verticillium alfalfae VaMs.102]EGY23817.1 hypothetical protein VDAG_05255 [Verticillium dahliae VdLs.17]
MATRGGAQLSYIARISGSVKVESQAKWMATFVKVRI